jgi:hypothetical protein
LARRIALFHRSKPANNSSPSADKSDCGIHGLEQLIDACRLLFSNEIEDYLSFGSLWSPRTCSSHKMPCCAFSPTSMRTDLTTLAIFSASNLRRLPKTLKWKVNVWVQSSTGADSAGAISARSAVSGLRASGQTGYRRAVRRTGGRVRRGVTCR